MFTPNWFEKQHIEEFIGRELTDDEWSWFLTRHEYSLADWLSAEVKNWVQNEVDWTEYNKEDE